jgi:hypothetical protein
VSAARAGDDRTVAARLTSSTVTEIDMLAAELPLTRGSVVTLLVAAALRNQDTPLDDAPRPRRSGWSRFPTNWSESVSSPTHAGGGSAPKAQRRRSSATAGQPCPIGNTVGGDLIDVARFKGPIEPERLLDDCACVGVLHRGV